MNKLVYDGTIRDPMVVPWICKKFVLLTTNKFFVHTNCISWQRSAVGGSCSSRQFNNSSQKLWCPPHVWCSYIIRRHWELLKDSQEAVKVTSSIIYKICGVLYIRWELELSPLSSIESNEWSVRYFLLQHRLRQWWVSLGFQANEF